MDFLSAPYNFLVQRFLVTRKVESNFLSKEFLLRKLLRTSDPLTGTRARELPGAELLLRRKQKDNNHDTDNSKHKQLQFTKLLLQTNIVYFANPSKQHIFLNFRFCYRYRFVCPWSAGPVRGGPAHECEQESCLRAVCLLMTCLTKIVKQPSVRRK